jgi:hypothetical protein
MEREYWDGKAEKFVAENLFLPGRLEVRKGDNET